MKRRNRSGDTIVIQEFIVSTQITYLNGILEYAEPEDALDTSKYKLVVYVVYMQDQSQEYFDPISKSITLVPEKISDGLTVYATIVTLGTPEVTKGVASIVLFPKAETGTETYTLTIKTKKEDKTVNPIVLFALGVAAGASIVLLFRWARRSKRKSSSNVPVPVYQELVEQE